ncbi:BMP family ABC transporter substrate-binding protein [Pseudactinotalea sp.]|uniref:BMP family ABC transporter substrate-binding protein n=1 Tax=Pseudactinotalea sp. TaxID=1926260 RepID=UPI003B3AFF02
MFGASKRTSIVKGAAVLVSGGLLLSACAGSGDDGTDPGGDDAEGIRVGVVLAGPRNDGAFYQSYLDGVIAHEEDYSLEISVVDNVEDPQAAIDAFTNLATDNDLIIAGGSALVPAGNTVAPQFPDVHFVMSGVVTEGVANLHTYATRQGVPAYVAGVIAAELSSSGVVGYVGGADIPPNAQSLVDFEAGALAGDAGIEVVSTTVGSFSDAAAAKEATAAQIANGADVIYAFQDAGLPGVLDAIEESGNQIPVFNPTTDRCEESEHLAGYAYQNTTVMVSEIVENYVAGELPSEPRFYALEDPNIQALRLCPAFDEYEDLAQETTDAINSGSITMPEGG